MKKIPPSFFDLRLRRSKNSPDLQSSINLRFSAPKSEEPITIFDLRPRRMGLKIGRERGEGWGVRLLRWWEKFLRIWGFSILRVRRTKDPPSSTFSARKTSKFTIFHFLGPKNKEPLPAFVFFRPPPSTNGHQLLSAILRSGYSERSSTLKIGPKTEIVPLRAPSRFA